MPIRLVLFAIGVIAVSFFPRLPQLVLLWGLLILLVLLIRYTRHYWAVALLSGLGWGVYSGHQLLAMQLNESLVGKDLIIVGVIADLPDTNDRRSRFNFNVHQIINSQGDILDIDDFPEKLQLSWYSAYHKNTNTQKITQLPELIVGQAWQLEVRLKRLRGFANPAGFDYHAWLLRQGIGATGYVINSTNTVKLENYPIVVHWREWIDHQRQLLQQWILLHSNSSERGILIALLIGDSSHVEKEQWNRMQQTGTSHLIAISGLHIGFLALFGFYIGLGAGKFIQLFWRPCPAFVIAWIMAIACASFYSALAGFNIPTVRTLIMLSIFYIACLAQRSVRIVDIFCCALALVLIIDPLAAYDMGFWLSFGAVALLLFYFSGRFISKKNENHWRGFSLRDMSLGFIRSQWVMFIGLLIPLSVLVNNISLVAPIANAIAIPLITFFVVPLLLISASLQKSFSSISDFLLNTAGAAMEVLKVILQKCLDWSGDYASPIVAFSPALSCLIAFSCLVLLLPKGLVHRAIGWCGLALGAWLAYFVPAVNVPELKISVMDVGQGTALVVQVKDKTLVYDTGPKYTESFDAGGAILAPYLFSQAISDIDVIVVSHNDMDHAGGLNSFLDKVSVKKILLGDIENTSFNQPDSSVTENCHQQKPWQWHKVSFEFLPVRATRNASDNNKSCVLLIRYQDQTILLPGDIETRVENQLLSENKIPENLTVLLAAHHGSRTSSGIKFVRHATPEIVVYSAGYRSQHGHPHPQILRRFQTINSRELNTAESGALLFEWYQDKPVIIAEYRKAHRRYWFE
ncbi:DNA internalization-related competence protein ComEC/Rec2 [Cellvibrio mixtus]|uniref:DNA internalization-related competence protein ComEC/Rec2 n=1 Tax=Cellvibrio mixtus TaxID=39650 RepID=UPI000587863D|nr:DNA internalization-related competence protein ComEC/Rec2 [Cellvibrio mixtus]